MPISKALAAAIQNENRISFKFMSPEAQKYLLSHANEVEVFSKARKFWRETFVSPVQWFQDAYRINLRKDVKSDIEEFIKIATDSIREGFLEGGTKELEIRVSMWMNKAVDWGKGERS